MRQTAIAIDMGGSHVKLGIVDEGGILAEDSLPVPCATLAAVLPQLNARIRALLAGCGIDARTMTGIGLGICAVADGNSSVLSANGKYDDAVGFDFARWAESTFGLPCVVENDTRLALLGEHSLGAARGFDDVVLVTLGTGIGGAVMLGGKLLRSRGHKAGGLAGHLVVAWNGRLCSCGNRGCAEAEASTTSLDEICRAHEGFAKSALASIENKIDFRTLFDAVDTGDSFAREVLDGSLRVWSALTVSLIHAYDPQVMVFGGGLMQRHESILPFVRDYVDRYAWTEKGSVSIVNSQLGSSAALFGALPLLRERA
jgi:glucokinase